MFEKLTGQVRKTDLNIYVDLIDSKSKSEDSGKEDSDNDKEDQESTDSTVLEGTSTDVIENGLESYLKRLPIYKPKYERPKSTPEDETHNEKIRKPMIAKVSNSGFISLKLDENRYKEAPESTQRRRRL